MLTKLTLTIDDGVVTRAKKYAQNRNRSVSRIVEEFLDLLSDETVDIDQQKKLESPLTDSLVGMFKDSGKPYKVMLEEALMEKHL